MKSNFKFRKIVDNLVGFLIENGVSLEEVKKELKGKEDFKIKSIIDRKLGEGKYWEWLDKLGNFASWDTWYTLYGLPANDRMKNFQLFKVEVDNFFGGAENELENYVKEVKEMMNDTHHFELDKSIIPLLKATKSDKTELPYRDFFISGEIEIKKKTYGGLFVYRTIITDKGIPAEEEVACLGLYLYNDPKAEKGEDYLIKFDYILLSNNSELSNFIYSFCNFLNEPDVEVIHYEINPKNNVRRKAKGLSILPAENVIRISGHLKRYIDDFSEGIRNGYSHRFWVRGHFMTFWNKKKYYKLYSLSEDKIKELHYQKKNDLIKKWKLPFVKGQGILVNKDYIVKIKENRNEKP